MKKVPKCNYMQHANSLAEREVGCPLDHCACGTHDAQNELHECEEPGNEEDIRALELAAGWDPTP